MVDITPVFSEYLARNKGPVPRNPELRQAPNYGVSATLKDSVIDLTLTFRSGSAYCCYESGCHLKLCDGKQWTWLHRELHVRGLATARPLELRLEIVVEAGSLFFDFTRPDSNRRGWYDFATERDLRFQKVLIEGPE